MINLFKQYQMDRIKSIISGKLFDELLLINEVLVIGEQSGESVEFDNEQFKEKMHKKYDSMHGRKV